MAISKTRGGDQKYWFQGRTNPVLARTNVAVTGGEQKYWANGQSQPTLFKLIAAATQRLATYSDIPSVLEYWIADAGVRLDASNRLISWQGQKGLIRLAQIYGNQYLPTYSATALNGKPGFTCTGGQSLYSANGDGTVANLSNLPAGTAAAAVLISSVAAASSVNQFEVVWGSFANQQLRAFGTNNGLAQFAGFYNDLVGNASLVNVDACVVTTLSGGANPVVSHYINGSLDKTAPLAAPLATPSPSQLQVFGVPNRTGVSPFNGVFRQLVLFASEPSTADRQMAEGIESWSTGKNGNNFAADHPYKNAPPMISYGQAVVNAVRRRMLMLIAS